jgi:hypothetical protein
VKRPDKRKPARAKPSSQEGGPLADIQLNFRALLRRVVAASVAEFRDDLLTSRTVLERQREFDRAA